MKENSIMAGLEETMPSYGHLPLELRHEEGIQNESAVPFYLAGQFPNSSSISIPVCSIDDHMEKKTHGIPSVPYAHDNWNSYPDNTPPHWSKPTEVNTPSLSLPYTQNPLDNKLPQTLYPSGKRYTNPPTTKISNSLLYPGKHQPQGDNTSEFPPLHGTHIATTSQPPLQNEPNPPLTKPDSPWNMLFTSNRIKANGTNLKFIPNPSHETKPTISITEDEVSAELGRWQNALVGRVIGAKPPFKLMKQYVDRRWRAFGKVDVFILKAGLFIFSFQDEVTKARILEMGPWSYFDKPLILKPWSSKEAYTSAEPENVPIWVRFPHLRLHLWSATTLSKIGSQIGVPLFTDRMTSQRERLAYARVCIEVNKDSTFPTSIDIKDHDGTIFSQQVEYEWVPTMCECCKQLGHKQSQCKRNIRKEWRPVDKPSNNSTPTESNEQSQAESKSNPAPDLNFKDNSMKQSQSPPLNVI